MISRNLLKFQNAFEDAKEAEKKRKEQAKGSEKKKKEKAEAAGRRMNELRKERRKMIRKKSRRLKYQKVFYIAGEEIKAAVRMWKEEAKAAKRRMTKMREETRNKELQKKSIQWRLNEFLIQRRSRLVDDQGKDQGGHASDQIKWSHAKEAKNQIQGSYRGYDNNRRRRDVRGGGGYQKQRTRRYYDNGHKDIQRRWEDMNIDCLVNVFEKVGMEAMLLAVPFVCKSWHQATLVPSGCWHSLIFPFTEVLELYSAYDPEDWKREPFLQRFVEKYVVNESSFSATEFIKFMVIRSEWRATSIQLPPYTTYEALNYIADRCLCLKELSLPSYVVYKFRDELPVLMKSWKNLESLSLIGPIGTYAMIDLLSEISMHCKEFASLHITKCWIDKENASAIVKFFPTIRQLSLKHASLPRECLLEILMGCKELLCLDVSYSCIQFTLDETDDEILELASLIPAFNCEKSYRENGYWSDDYFCRFHEYVYCSDSEDDYFFESSDDNDYEDV